MSADVLTALLREPGDVAERCERSEGLRRLAVTSLACLVVGAAVFGGVVGSFRGGMQIGYSAIKLPLALLTTLVVAVPAFFALTIGFGGRTTFRGVAALSLAASARGALVLIGCAPVLWLAVDRGLAYHASVMLATVMYLASGLAALGIVLRGLDGSFRAVVTSAACALVFFGVLGQTAWMLRPFFGRPSQTTIPFVRPPEGTLADALVTSSKSAAGIYDRAERVRHAAKAEVREQSQEPTNDADPADPGYTEPTSPESNRAEESGL
jgi:hypothetical protein